MCVASHRKLALNAGRERESCRDNITTRTLHVASSVDSAWRKSVENGRKLRSHAAKTDPCCLSEHTHSATGLVCVSVSVCVCVKLQRSSLIEGTLYQD